MMFTLRSVESPDYKVRAVKVVTIMQARAGLVIREKLYFSTLLIA
jgi:hypothetical protein